MVAERESFSRARAIAAAVTCKVSTQPLSDDAWVALCVRDDADWAHMVEAMGRPDLLRDARFASAEQRRLAHDEFDTVVADWTRTQTAVGNRQCP